MRPGFLLFRVESDTAFVHEAGGHRWQRAPKNDKRGRVHTSTVTVAVLKELTDAEVHIDPGDIEEKFVRGTGAGGQHRNVTDTCVQLTHKPTGIQIRCDGGRSQWANRQTALSLLRCRLLEAEEDRARAKHRATRKSQVGTGMRADKRRTVAIQRDQVVDHVTGKSTTTKKYLRGHLSDLWK